MKMITPSLYQSIQFHMTMKVGLDNVQEELRKHNTFTFPTQPLNEQNRKVWELATRQTMSEYLNEWLDTVFANIVAEKT